ncbi:hypothetical protein Tco_1302778 [Tanacetum coccineum]
MTHPEEVKETIGTPMEVEPLHEPQLEDLGLNTCNHDISLSSREVPSFDEPEPQLLPNFSPLDINLRGKIGIDPPIKPYSPDSFRMEVVDNLTIHTPPSPHVASFHPKDIYCYYHPCVDDPKKHYGFKPGLLRQGGSLGVDLLNCEVIENNFLRRLSLPVKPNGLENVENINSTMLDFTSWSTTRGISDETMPNIQLNSKFCEQYVTEWERQWAHRIELGMQMQVKSKTVKFIIVMGIGLLHGTVTQMKHPRKFLITQGKMLLNQAQENGQSDEEELLLSLSLLVNRVHILENAIDHSVNNLDEHEIHNEVQQTNVIDSTSVDMDLEKRKAEELKANALPLPVLPPATVAMKAVFENLEAEVDQNEIDLKSGEIERKNLLITNENLIAECLSKDVFYTATDSVLNVSRFSDMHDAFTIVSAQTVEHFNLQLKYQNLKERFGNKKPVTSSDAPSFDSLFVIGKLNEQIQSRGNTIHELKEKISRLTKKNSDADPIFDLKALVSQNKDLTAKLNALHDLNERFRAENAKVKQHYKEFKPKVLAPSRYPIDVEPIPPRLKKNREVHLHYIKHLKENVETLREIVEDAKVERPLDTSLASACRYTKHSQELLEYVIGTCPKDFSPRDKQNASTNSLRKKRVSFVEPCETSTHNTPPQVEHQKINSTNAPGIPSTGVNGASAASRSKPRSNTKKDRTLPAKSALKQVEAHSRMNKSNEKQKNHVDSSISYKRTWRPTGRLLPLGDQWPLTRNTPPKVLPTKQWKPTGRLLPLGRQCPLVRSTALKSDCMPADPQETLCPIA